MVPSFTVYLQKFRLGWLLRSQWLWMSGSSALSANQDNALEAFIALVRQDPDLKAQIKAALNQDQVIDIAALNGFDIDSAAILRKWSQHTDFSQDTWMGWFEE